MEKQAVGTNARGFVLELKRMKNQFVADGEDRFKEGLRQSAGSRQTNRRVQGGVLKWLWLRLGFAAGRADSKSPGHRPSPGTLW